MPTLDEVWKQIDSLPHKYVFQTKKEIRYLPRILGNGERILALTSGFMNNKTWLCVCTNRRVLFLNRGMFFGLRQVQMNLDRIQSIDSSYTIFFGTLRFWDGAASISIGMVLKASIAPFVRTVQDAMDRYKREMVHDIVGNAQRVKAENATPVAPTVDKNAPPAWVVELRHLTQMKEAGHLSEEEFSAAKAKLLG